MYVVNLLVNLQNYLYTNLSTVRAITGSIYALPQNLIIINETNIIINTLIVL